MLSLAPLGETAAEACDGDCDRSGRVVISELVACVTIALGSAPLDRCIPCDADENGRVAVNELIKAILSREYCQ